MKGNPKSADSVTYSQNFAAKIRKSSDGKHRLEVRSKRWYLNQLAKFKDGEDVTLVMHNKRPKRTLAQNAYYWGPFMDVVVEQTGEQDRDRLHELFKGKFLTTGIEDVLGEKVRIKKSTTNLSISDFSQYITDICALTGVSPPPTESWGLDPLKYPELST